jgi:hypothetical protein
MSGENLRELGSSGAPEGIDAGHQALNQFVDDELDIALNLYKAIVNNSPVGSTAEATTKALKLSVDAIKSLRRG